MQVSKWGNSLAVRLPKALVDALYSGVNDVHIKVDMTFEDGRKGTIEGDIAIRDLAPQHAVPLKKAS